MRRETRDVGVACFVALLALTTWAKSSAEIEAEAEKKLGEAGRANACPLYLEAAKQRIVETEKLYSQKKKDAIEIDTESLDDVDEEMLPGSSKVAEQFKLDQEALHYLQTAVDFDMGAKPTKCDEWLARAKAVKGTSKKATEQIEKFQKKLDADRDPNEYDPKPAAKKEEAPKPDPIKAIQEKLDAAIAGDKAKSIQADLWGKLAYEAFLHFRPDLMVQAKEAFAKLKKQPGCYPGIWVSAITAYENLKTFPKSEEATAAPKTLKDLGVAEKHTIVAGELDWNAEDATECVENALSSGATTIIFEDKGSPWYVKSIVPRSNQRLVFKKGVKVLMDKVSRQLKDKSPMILLKGVKNVIIEGEGGPGDVYIGKYASLAERNKYSNDYGASGMDIVGGSHHCVIRNITFGANSCDGVCLGGGREIWLENLVLTENYRQAMSVCDAAGLYCRNVSFLNTIGNDPMCGIDFEPTFETEANADCYFYDCTFGGNAGAAVNWSSSSYFPVTCHMKRCHFEKAPNCGQITIFARCGIYLNNNVKAPSKIVFEDCDMHVYTDSFPLKIDNASFFDIEVKNFKITEIPRGKWGNSPVTFNLTRSYGKGINDYQSRCGGKVHIEGLDVTGWKDYPILEFRDRVGTYSVAGISGSGTMNGKTYDMSKFRYDAPEINLEHYGKFVPGDYLPPVQTTAANPDVLPVSFGLSWGKSWFEPEPVYRALYFEDGAWKVKKIQTCVTELGLKTQPVAYYCRGNGSVFKLAPRKDKQPYTLYFEVPGGKPATFKLIWGKGVLKNAKGEVAKTFDWGGSAQYCECKTASDKSEIWALTLESGAALRFFAPFNGIVAESPDALPRRK